MTGPSRRIAVAACAAALAAALWQAPDAFHTASADARALERESAADRSLSGALSTDISRDFLLRAEQLLPSNAVYAVVTGPKVEVSTPVTLAAVGPFANYWLLPRVQVADPKQAQWILSYGGDLPSIGLEYAQVVEVSPGLAIAEVKHA